MEQLRLLNTGEQDCRDMHSWGPGIRPCYLLHYIIRGAGYLKAEDKLYEIRQGQSFLTYPYTMIEYYPKAEEPWYYTWVDFEGELLEEELALSGFRRKSPVFYKDMSERLPELFARLQKLDIIHKNKREANALLAAVLGCYRDACGVTREAMTADSDMRLETALKLIQANYHKEDFGVSELCEYMGVSRATLYRLFQSRLKLAPQAYLLKYRLNQARELLLLGTSVKTTALSCGFADPFYFSKVFKERFGVSPSKFARIA